MMISAIAKKMTEATIKYNIVSKDEYDIYQYGFELLVSTSLNLFIAIIVGIVIKELMGSIFIWIILALVRSKTGGYHADSYLKCNLVFTNVLIVTLLWVKYSFTYYTYYAVFIHHLVYISCVATLCPIENKNKPLDDEQKKKNKTLSILFGVLSFIISVALCTGSVRKMAALLSVTVLNIAFFVIVGYFKEKRCDHNNEESYH